MALASVFIACSGGGTETISAHEESSGGEEGREVRPVEGDICAAYYESESDSTAIGLELSNGLAMGALLVGDGWEINCAEESDLFLIAQSDREDSFLTATISVDRSFQGEIDAEETAKGFRQLIAQAFLSQGAENLRMSDPEFLSDDSFFVMLEASIEGVRVVQVNVWKLIPSPIGLMRMQATHSASDPDLLVENVEAMGEGVARFALYQIEENN